MDSEFVDVVSVRPVGGYLLQLTLSDSTVRLLDVEPLMWTQAFDPIRANYEAFNAVRVDPSAGTIVWPINGATLPCGRPPGATVFQGRRGQRRPADPPSAATELTVGEGCE